MSAELEGLKELEKNFNNLLSKMDKVNHDALQKAAIDLLGKAIDLAPVDKGDLRGSGTVKPDGDNAVDIGFTEPYAVYQHEHTEFKHPKGGQAKYLEQPFRQNTPKYIDDIAEVNRDALK